MALPLPLPRCQVRLPLRLIPAAAASTAVSAAVTRRGQRATGERGEERRCIPLLTCVGCVAVSVWVSGLSGVCSGVLSAALLQPLDVVKTAMISPAYTQSGRPPSLRSLSMRLMREEGGLSRLWRGLQPALLRISLGSALYFTTQASLIDALQRHHQTAATTRSPQQAGEEGQHLTAVLAVASVPSSAVLIDCVRDGGCIGGLCGVGWCRSVSGVRRLSAAELMGVGASSRSVAPIPQRSHSFHYLTTITARLQQQLKLIGGSQSLAPLRSSPALPLSHSRCYRGVFQCDGSRLMRSITVLSCVTEELLWLSAAPSLSSKRGWKLAITPAHLGSPCMCTITSPYLPSLCPCDARCCAG